MDFALIGAVTLLGLRTGGLDLGDSKGIMDEDSLLKSEAPGALAFSKYWVTIVTNR